MSILETMGFHVQKTLLGRITLASSKGNRQVYPVVACENFVPEDKTLIEFKMIESALLDIKPPKIPWLAHIYEIMQKPNAYFSEEFSQIAMAAYWDQFIADALLGNFDRHANNWGYLVDRNTREVSLAPVYDCGSCLYPQIADDGLERILNSSEEIQKRIDVFPQAALIIDGKKVSYKRYIASFENPDCTEALMRVAPRIDKRKICDVVRGTEGISALRKEFYIKMLLERNRQIIMEPYLELIS